jgi:hypothetical protein
MQTEFMKLVEAARSHRRALLDLRGEMVKLKQEGKLRINREYTLRAALQENPCRQTVDAYFAHTSTRADIYTRQEDCSARITACRRLLVDAHQAILVNLGGVAMTPKDWQEPE